MTIIMHDPQTRGTESAQHFHNKLKFVNFCGITKLYYFTILNEK